MYFLNRGYYLKQCYGFNAKNKFSSGGNSKVKISSFRKFFNYIGENKQAVVNTLGIYFVLSYSIYNYKVKLAWDDLQKDFDKTQIELARLKDTLLNDEFIKQIENSNRKAIKEVITNMIQTSKENENKIDNPNFFENDNILNSKLIGTNIENLDEKNLIKGKVI